MKELILLVLAAGLLAAAYVVGFLVTVLGGDSTGIVYGVAALGLIATALSRRKRSLLVWIVSWDVAPALGLLGTAIGFYIALQGVSDGNLMTKLGGIYTAISTTIVGLIVHLWLLIVREATR